MPGAHRELCGPRKFGAALLLALSGVHGPALARQEVDLLSSSDAVRINGVDVGDLTGVRATSCDVNGDGLQDLVISAREADGVDNTRPLAGEAYVIYGREGAWTGSIELATDADVRIIGEESFDSLH